VTNKVIGGARSTPTFLDSDSTGGAPTVTLRPVPIGVTTSSCKSADVEIESIHI